MKVVHVVRQFHPSIGGMEEVVLNVARQHQATSADTVEVVTLDRVFTDPGAQLAAQDTHQGLSIRRIGYRGSSRYPLAPSVLGAIRSADVVHLHGIDFLRLSGIDQAVARQADGGVHARRVFPYRLRIAHEAAVVPDAHAHLGTGLCTRDRHQRKRWRSVRQGGGTGAAAGDRKRCGRRKICRAGATTPGRTMLYFGRWSVNKGLIETLELLQAALKRDPQWRLIIAGREYDLNEADLRKAIAERGLQDKVQLSMSPSQEQLRALMQQAQFFVCLSRHEGFGIAAVEAMSAGLIPILSDIPPFVRLASESGQGVIVNRDRIEAAADQVQALALQSDSDFDTRRSASMAYVSRYDWKHVVGRYVDEYHDALGIPRVQEAVR